MDQPFIKFSSPEYLHWIRTEWIKELKSRKEVLKDTDSKMIPFSIKDANRILTQNHGKNIKSCEDYLCFVSPDEDEFIDSLLYWWLVKEFNSIKERFWDDKGVCEFLASCDDHIIRIQFLGIMEEVYEKKLWENFRKLPMVTFSAFLDFLNKSNKSFFEVNIRDEIINFFNIRRKNVFEKVAYRIL